MEKKIRVKFWKKFPGVIARRAKPDEAISTMGLLRALRALAMTVVQFCSCIDFKKGILGIYFLVRLPFILAIKLIFAVNRQKPQEIKRILVIRLDRIGDFVLTLPVIENLKLAYPEAQLDVIVRPPLEDLASSIKRIDSCLVYTGLFSSLTEIRKRKYDLAVDMLCDYTLRSSLLCFFSLAPLRIGFAGGWRQLFFTASVAEPKSKKSMLDMHLAVLELLDVPIKVKEPKISITGIQSAKPNRVVIHPGGHYPSQRWGDDNFKELARRIVREYNVTVVFIAGPGDYEGLNRIVSSLDEERVTLFSSGLPELCLLLQGSRLFIGNNSGPLHLAAAVGIPTVSTMGPSDPVLWQPQGQGHKVIRKGLPCSPCAKAKCRSHECMRQIQVEEVFKAVESVIRNRDIGKF